jgi:hypothetical protein
VNYVPRLASNHEKDYFLKQYIKWRWKIPTYCKNGKASCPKVGREGLEMGTFEAEQECRFPRPRPQAMQCVER